MSARICKKLFDQFFAILKDYNITFAPYQKPAIEDFFYFLIGYYDSDEIGCFMEEKEAEFETSLFFTDILNGKVSFKKFFPLKLRKIILAKKDWNLSYLYKYKPETRKKDKNSNKEKNDKEDKDIHAVLNKALPDLLNLHSRYFRLSFAPLDAESILMDILHNSLFLLNNSFEKTHHYLSANTTGFLTPTKEVMDKFISTLMKHPKLILEGVPGSGKTTFIKYFLQDNPCIDSYLVDYTCSLEYTLSQILYEGMGKDLSYKEIIKLLKEKPECSLLIIDGMDLPAEELSQRLKILQKFPLHIIVTTRNTTYTDSNFHRFRLPDPSDDNLLDLYQKISNTKETFENDRRERFLTLTHRNILTVSLLAYASKQDSSILDVFLSDEGTLTMPEMTLQKFKHPYDRQTQTTYGASQKDL